MQKEFFEKAYYFELERKNEIVNSLGIPIGAISAVLGAATIATVSNEFEFVSRLETVVNSLLVISLIGLYVCGCLCIYALVRAVNGQPYKYLPSPDEIKKYVDDLRKFYELTGLPNFQKNIEADFETYLIDAYASCSADNWKCNFEKSSFRFKAHRYLTGSIVFLVISLLPYYVNQQLNPSFQRMEIIAVENSGPKHEQSETPSIASPNGTEADTTAAPSQTNPASTDND